MSKIKSFREWCKENDPFFDFFSKILITSITGIIAYYAVSIANAQGDIQKAALEVQRIQAQTELENYLPNVQVRYSLRKSDGPRIDDFIVSNEGAELFSLEVEIFPFWHPRELEIIRQGEKKKDNVQLKSALVPIRNFFSPVTHASSDLRGQLRIFLGKSHVQWDRAVREFEKSTTTERRSIATDTKLFSRITYMDKFGKSHIRYFETQYWGMRPIIESEGVEIANKYYQNVKSGNSIDFDDPTKKIFEINWRVLSTPQDPSA